MFKLGQKTFLSTESALIYGVCIAVLQSPAGNVYWFLDLLHDGKLHRVS